MKIKNIDVEVIRGDITELNVEALVNPANTELRMEGGLAGFLKECGGEEVEEEARTLAPIKVGEAVATKAGKLKPEYVIHAATMSMDGLTNQDHIREAVASAFQCACKLQIRSLAMPALGCGIGGFPIDGVAKIMVQEIIRLVKESSYSLSKIFFCLYDKDSYEVFNRTFIGYVRHMQETLGPGPYVTVDIIIEMDDGIVLIERSNPPYGMALPGGFVDYGESLKEAAHREAKEETNLDLVNLRQFHTYSNPDRDPRFHTISTVFVAKGHGTAQSGSDAQSLEIVKYADLLQLDYAFDHKDIIKEYLVEKDFSSDQFF